MDRKEKQRQRKESERDRMTAGGIVRKRHEEHDAAELGWDNDFLWSDGFLWSNDCLFACVAA